MGKKKHKKARYAYGPEGLPGSVGYGLPPEGADALSKLSQQLFKNNPNAGLLRNLPGMFSGRRGEHFLLGALIGAAAAYALSDEELRAKLIKSGLKLYSGLIGGFEEMKEQVADLKAEVEAEHHA